ncbi:hypothetical protein P256_01676 [Acinetobacter nectaris CIP 110549]|uniref:Cation efflux protein transmembrane domain-containing protein n=1 Tax=Acinetobacter nectaris CIP 110549 TaxID=1392540 RepID=V2TNC6_9GAMM|nr:cation diffusion facilitator family transporter [Acinetobacter nectaris]ESK38857.1 hypothetical protein P256_01676 [Acinetobacter nectaris CIP 110549]
MQKTTYSPTHSHVFDEGNPLAQRKILIATIFTAVMMVLEIVCGSLFNSMALLADGWHMSSHMVALGLAYVAYKAAQHYAKDPRFCFGTWKIEVLAAYTSAIILMMVAVFMGYESIVRLLHPIAIQYNDAIFVATLGLIVNLICAWLLKDNHGHGHHDINQKAAFLHVVADAATSIFAILALFAGKYLGWNFLDSVLGIVGAFLVAHWAWGLIQQAGKTLLDAEMDHPLVERVMHSFDILQDKITITDIHLWKVGTDKFSCILALQTHDSSISRNSIQQILLKQHEIVHTSIEIRNI